MHACVCVNFRFLFAAWLACSQIRGQSLRRGGGVVVVGFCCRRCCCCFLIAAARQSDLHFLWVSPASQPVSRFTHGAHYCHLALQAPRHSISIPSTLRGRLDFLILSFSSPSPSPSSGSIIGPLYRPRICIATSPRPRFRPPRHDERIRLSSYGLPCRSHLHIHTCFDHRCRPSARTRFPSLDAHFQRSHLDACNLIETSYAAATSTDGLCHARQSLHRFTLHLHAARGFISQRTPQGSRLRFRQSSLSSKDDGATQLGTSRIC